MPELMNAQRSKEVVNSPAISEEAEEVEEAEEAEEINHNSRWPARLTSNIAKISKMHCNLSVNKEMRENFYSGFRQLPGGIRNPLSMIKSFVENMGTPIQNRNSKSADQIFKITQVWGLVSEASSQMSELNSILTAIKENCYLENGFCIAIKSIVSNLIKSVSTATGGPIGGLLAENILIKDLFDLITEKNPKWEIKNLYPLITRIDEKLTESYLGHAAEIDAGDVGASIAGYTIKKVIPVTETLGKFVPFKDIWTLIYERCKVSSGLKPAIIEGLIRFIEELKVVLINETEVAGRCFRKLFPEADDSTPFSLHRGTRVGKILRSLKISEDLSTTFQNIEYNFGNAMSSICEIKSILVPMLESAKSLSKEQERIEEQLYLSGSIGTNYNSFNAIVQ